MISSFRQFFSLCISLAFLSGASAQAQLFKKQKERKAAELAAQTKLPPLQTGQYEWTPEKAPAGPLLIVVSIDDQMAYVYRNGTMIGRSTVSTGKPGKETPTGVFSILEKKKDHTSSIYGSKMPNMQRLTWTGIALHAGAMPGYPASAGCVRLPLEFSAKLFEATETGATVAITQRSSYPSKSETPASLLLATQVGNDSIPIPERKPFWNPAKSPSGPVALLLSIGDSTVYVYRNGILIGQAPIGIAPGNEPIPGGLFLMLNGTLPGENPITPGRPMRAWSILTIDAEKAPQTYPMTIIRSRIRVHPEFARNVYDLMSPGSLMLVTRDKSTSQTRSGRDFVIIDPD